MYKLTHHSELQTHEKANLFNGALENGVDWFVFYDGGVTCWRDWLDYIEDMKCWVVQCEHPEKGVIGFWWLNTYVGKSAMIHFCHWQMSLAEMLDLGRQSMQWLADTKIFDSVYGITPKPYRNVMPYMEKLGFEITGEIPGACHILRYKKYVPGIVSVLDLKEKYNGQEIDTETAAAT